MDTISDAERLLRDYPRIFFACHARHVRDPESGRDLSRNQASILSHLDEVEPTSVSELAEHMGVTVSTMSLSVKRLVRQGYVVRARSPEDRRVVELRLSDSGVRVREAARVLEPRLVEELLGQLAPEEREAALQALERLAEAADRLVREGADDPAPSRLSWAS